MQTPVGTDPATQSTGLSVPENARLKTGYTNKTVYLYYMTILHRLLPICHSSSCIQCLAMFHLFKVLVCILVVAAMFRCFIQLVSISENITKLTFLCWSPPGCLLSSPVKTGVMGPTVTWFPSHEGFTFTNVAAIYNLPYFLCGVEWIRLQFYGSNKKLAAWYFDDA